MSEAPTDFLQDEKATRGGNLKGLWKDSRSRMVILLFGGVAVVMMFFVLAGGNKNQREPIQAKAMPVTAPVSGGDPTQTSPNYRKLVDEKNEERAKEAANSPTLTVLPRIAGLTDPDAKKAEAEAKPAPAPQPQAQQQQQPQTNQQTSRGGYAGDQAYQNALRFYGDQIEKQWTPNKHVVVMAPADQQRNQQQAPVAGNTAGGTPTGTTQPQAKVLISAGTISYATVDLTVNSDFSGPVMATILDGPLKGARLIGAKTLERDMVVIKFNRASRPNAPAIQVDAYAINISDAEKFGQTGMRTDIDHHYFSRYVLPGAAAFLRGVGEAVGRGNSTTTTGALGTTSTSGALDKSQQVAVGVGEMSKMVAEDLAKNRSVSPTVKLAANTEIGIVFANDVTEK